MAHLGELIAELRQDRGLTQKELGDILCVSSGTISNYENGVHLPDVDKVIALANYFHVTTDYLLGRTSSNLPVELLQQAITNEKTLGDVMASFAKLPANRQAALSLIINVELNEVTVVSKELVSSPTPTNFSIQICSLLRPLRNCSRSGLSIWAINKHFLA